MRLSPVPGDRQAAEAGVRQAYQAAGHRPPGRIIWCAGPIELARLWAQAQRGEWAGANLKAEIVDRMRRQVHAAIAERVTPRLMNRVVATGRRGIADSVDTGIREAVLRSANMIKPRKLALARRILFRPYSLGKVWNCWLTFEQSGCCSHDLEWLGSYGFLREVCNIRNETEALNGLRAIAANTGWFVPHENVCWISERHNILRYDTNGRLHCDNGPALQYPDRWSVYAWKGVIVRRRLIEHPEEVTVSAIDRETDVQVRRCMIEIFTPARYISEGGAMRVSSDDAGILWHKRWDNGDTWAAVEVVNGTPEPDGTYKHYFLQVPPICRTACEAVAWTYGMTERQYARVIVRT
jgi:hypothetical protein